MKEGSNVDVEYVVKCDHCGEVFPHDDLNEIEEHGCYESDYGVYDQFSSHTYYNYTIKVCPHCGNEDYTKGYICNECEEFVDYLEDEDYGICMECVSKYTDEEYESKYPPIKSEVKDNEQI